MTEQNVHQRMLNVTKAVGNVAKGNKTVNGKYRFVSHDDVTKAVQPYLIEHGLNIIPRVTSWRQDGNRTEVDMDLEIVNVDKPDDTVVVPCFGFGIDNQDKGPGKAVSYATKYGLLKAFCLETGDDPDNDVNVQHKPSQTDKAREIYKQVQKASSAAALDKITLDNFTDLEELRDSDPDKHKAIMDLVEKKGAALNEKEAA